MYYDDIFLQNGFIDMLCKISNQFVERLDVLSFDDVRPLAVWKQRINYDEPSMSVSILFTPQDQQNVKFHCDEMPES